MAYTFQKLMDGGMRVTAHCNDMVKCVHSQPLDLKALAESLGPDAPAMESDLRPKLRCSKCGGRNVSLIYSPIKTSGYVGPVTKAYTGYE